MDWIFSSSIAWKKFSGIVPEGGARFISDPLRFSSKIKKKSRSIALIADITQIDDELAKRVTDVQRENGIPVGVIPFSSGHAKHFERHFIATTGVDRQVARCVLYSVDRGFVKDVAKTLRQTEEIPSPTVFNLASKGFKVSHALKSQPTTCFAAQASGRQTFIQICKPPAACLYPDLRGDLHMHSGAITPTNSRIEHFFVQSCHSPFVWSDFGGNYLSVPLAFLLADVTRTFIASTRVQATVPGVVPLYFHLAREGQTVGQIALELNSLARNLIIEDDPFILFGNPECKVLAGHQKPKPSIIRADDSKTRKFVAHTKHLGRIIANLDFTKKLFDPDNDSKDEAVSRLTRTIADIRTHFEAKIRRLRGPFRFPTAWDANDIDAFTTALLGQDVSKSFKSIPNLVERVWLVKRGFYYSFSDALENGYLPNDCSSIKATCLACGSRQLQKRLGHAGIDTPANYIDRIQEICSRCLVTADTAAFVRTMVKRTVTKTKKGLIATIEYKNLSLGPQWVFAFGMINDPQNVNSRLPQDVYGTVLGSLRLLQKPIISCILQPLQKTRFRFEITGVEDGLFYLLLELNLFVDGCWNWFGVTLRSTGVRPWIDSALYKRTLPHQIRHP